MRRDQNGHDMPQNDTSLGQTKQKQTIRAAQPKKHMDNGHSCVDIHMLSYLRFSVLFPQGREIELLQIVMQQQSLGFDVLVQ